MPTPKIKDYFCVGDVWMHRRTKTVWMVTKTYVSIEKAEAHLTSIRGAERILADSSVSNYTRLNGRIPPDRGLPT